MYKEIIFIDQQGSFLARQNPTKTNIDRLLTKGRSLKKNKLLFGDTQYVIKGIVVEDEMIYVHCRKIGELDPYIAEWFGQENLLKKKRGS